MASIWCQNGVLIGYFGHAHWRKVGLLVDLYSVVWVCDAARKGFRDYIYFARLYLYIYIFSIFRKSTTVQSLVTKLASSNVACVPGSFFIYCNTSTAKHLQRSSKYIAVALECKLSWVELCWVELSWVELSWVELSWVELSWVFKANQSTEKWNDNVRLSCDQCGYDNLRLIVDHFRNWRHLVSRKKRDIHEE